MNELKGQPRGTVPFRMLRNAAEESPGYFISQPCTHSRTHIEVDGYVQALWCSCGAMLGWRNRPTPMELIECSETCSPCSPEHCRAVEYCGDMEDRHGS